MVNEEKRLLKVFLCHASGDKPQVRELYKKLVAEGVDAWLDQERLLPGQDWRLEIPKVVHDADVVVICLSNKSVTKEGYVQKEIKFALDIAEEKPEGTIFLIPARLEECAVPERLSRWHWVDLFEEDGFTKLLRSLKLRANKVGAVIELVSYQESDKELQRRLDQLYTDGLAAFYTEDWEKACFYFQTILSERPSHRNATEKLAEAECQRKLAQLYTRSTEAVQSENWRFAIQSLEELLQKSTSYKDAAQLLRDARKREQLHELNTEARALFAAQKWQAVVKVFDQIAVIEPNFPDGDGLLASARREVVEGDRLARLNDHYSQALRELDAGNWHEARRLLETVHKSQTGFLETEKLLRKAENEVVKEEEKRQRDQQIDTLYEQAHGLLRSKKWRKALDKLEEIRTLDEHFADSDGIGERAQEEVEVEEQEADRQNHLASLYAEAVKLLKEEKSREALDKWQEIRALDPAYPDRQSLQKTASRKLAGTGSMFKRQLRLPRLRNKWIVTGGVVTVLLAALSWLIFMEQATVMPECTSVTGIQDPLFLESKSRSSPVFVDGKISYPTEWTSAGCYQLNLILHEEGKGCTGDFSITTTWLLMNDSKRLYVLVRIPRALFTPAGAAFGYYYPYPYGGGWQHSDTMGIDQGQPLDQFGWNDKEWQDDVSVGGTMDTVARETLGNTYRWYEFSKPIASGDRHDWQWTLGNRIGTDISGDLMIGTWGHLPDAAGMRYFCRYAQLQLEK